MALLGVLCGCNGAAVEAIPPRDVGEALRRVNENFARLEQPLLCRSALVSFSYRDPSGQVRRYIAQPAALIYRAPRCLYFDIKSIGGSVARVGSNDERYWLWVEPEVSTMWWGTWADAGGAPPPELPLPPDQLFDALMLRPLTAELPDSLAALLRLRGDDHRLIYVRVADDGRTSVAREIVLSPKFPYLPTQIADWDADGQPTMRAELGDYKRVGPEGPYTARHFVIRWPANAAELRLDLPSAVLRPDQPEFCDFPMRPPVVRVERLTPAARSTGSEEATDAP